MRLDTPLGDTQQRILEHLQTTPGASVQAVAAAVGVDHSTAEYHLHRLTRANLVRSVRTGRVRAHYVAGAPLCPYLREIGPRFSPEERLVLARLGEGPTTPLEASSATGVPLGRTRWTIEKALAAGLAQPAGYGRYAVPHAMQPCVAHLAANAVCRAWGQCATSRSPRFTAAAAPTVPTGGLLLPPRTPPRPDRGLGAPSGTAPAPAS